MTRQRSRRPPWKTAAAWAIAGTALAASAVFIATRSGEPSRSEPAATRTVATPTPPAGVPAGAERVEAPASAPEPAAAARPPAAPELPWASILRDPARSLRDRVRAARELAVLETPGAFAALVGSLPASPTLVKAAIAESLGISRHPDALAAILELLEDPEPTVARGAVRGLAERGGPEAAGAFADILSREGSDPGVREEAAIALGRIRTPWALETLARAALEAPGEAMKAAALKGLGARPFSETGAFFEEYLASPGTGAALRAAALEALGNAEGDPTPLLARHLSDASPAVREAALEAMSMTEAPGRAAVELLGRLADEKEPGMRSMIYRALGNQEDFEPESVLDAVRDEGRPDVRVAGLDVLAGACARGAAPQVLEFFERDAVPELEVTALTDPEPANRMAAVIALRKAGTAGAAAALETIARDAADPKTAEAARAETGR